MAITGRQTVLKQFLFQEIRKLLKHFEIKCFAKKKRAQLFACLFSFVTMLEVVCVVEGVCGSCTLLVHVLRAIPTSYGFGGDTTRLKKTTTVTPGRESRRETCLVLLACNWAHAGSVAAQRHGSLLPEWRLSRAPSQQGPGSYEPELPQRELNSAGRETRTRRLRREAPATPHQPLEFSCTF